MRADADVLIVGGGPTGLMLAGDLAAAGVSCAVVERRDAESGLSRAFAVHARTLELLDARGIARDLIARGLPIPRLAPFGLQFFRLPSRFPYMLGVPQYETERVLGARARDLGAEILLGTEMIRLSQDGDGVDLTVRDSGREERTLRARYVVGADGVRSTVRRELGLPFPGRAAVRSVMLCDVRFAEPPRDAVTARATADGFVFAVPFGDDWYRVIAWDRAGQRADTAPVELREVRAITRRVLGTDFGMHGPRWLSRFHSDERQAPRYRVGRVFLAGDAAHAHSPAGGMGMNTGLQDAVNLAWKLTAAVRGWAPERLLDSYHAERYPVGRRVLRTSGVILRCALLRPRVLRAARDAALRAATHVGPVARRMAGAVSGIDLAYPAPPGSHPLAGRRAPDVPLAGGTPGTLYHALRPGRFLLVMPPDAVSPAAVTGGWEDRVDHAIAGGPTRRAVLVRPDAYIAWAGEDAHPGAVRAALERWCGPARPVRARPAVRSR
ncbi:FAD-dependent oxidoreductase [Sphaerisporangium siamense]|uniref:2-polyprenyl-6-methoxyphenol hydroxylase-like FAD-dependent oxidoreductase n=1 Tax=Sphaerisporangium siamense TaxID=795645 RepID=A0A7W7GDY9_9ACTN|nr:FAD-dependent monooxygenase [Sphaerisporangium siamense]MBB4705505.1 2-polyprenyl-6-methoxyphenol hydroxylase-like FAD-dependent oxidoreductase [Sphaerisporangium siamense]GII83117.1 FAD-dependent oxidoreductase [Sphaerisporangium siamense]